MANITSITAVEAWFLREIPSHTKLTAQLTNKVNTLIANQVLINAALEQLLQGATGGSEQAHLAMYNTSAPTGWTQVTSHNDMVIRLVNTTGGVAGANDPKGTGGAWAVTGLSSGMEAAHTHGMSSHTHTISTSTQDTTTTTTDGFHHHAIAVGGSHNHGGATGTNGSGQVNSGAGSGDAARGPHTHSVSTDGNHDHGGFSEFEGYHTHTLTHAHTGTSAAPNTNTSEAGSAHNHSVTQDGTWRPSYVNLILVKKD